MAERSTNVFKAAIVAALAVEYSAVRPYLIKLHEEVHPEGTVYERGIFLNEEQQWDVCTVVTSMGNVNAALEVERLIRFFKPDLALFVGVAGGLKEDVKLGDVVVASKVYGYGSGKASATFQTRPEVSVSSYLLVKRAEAEARKANWLQRLEKPLLYPVPGAFIAPIAAGEQVLASTRSAVYKFLRMHYNDALAVEMEGYGFLKAVQANPQLDALVIRGISDLIDGKSESDRASSQEIAARHASTLRLRNIHDRIEGGKVKEKKPCRNELLGSCSARKSRKTSRRSSGVIEVSSKWYCERASC